jgi:hypothetical protein
LSPEASAARFEVAVREYIEKQEADDKRLEQMKPKM